MALRAYPASAGCGARGLMAGDIKWHRKTRDPDRGWGNQTRGASRSSPGSWAWRCRRRPLCGLPLHRHTEVEVPVAPVRRGDFVISVRTRGDIKSARSSHPEGARRCRACASCTWPMPGRPVKKGEVVVEFDGTQQEQNVISRPLTVRRSRWLHRPDPGHADDRRRRRRHEQDDRPSTIVETRQTRRQQGRGIVGD